MNWITEEKLEELQRVIDDINSSMGEDSVLYTVDEEEQVISVELVEVDDNVDDPFVLDIHRVGSKEEYIVFIKELREFEIELNNMF